MSSYEQSAALLDALSMAGRQKGRTTSIIQLAIADVVNSPVIVAANHRQAHNLQRIVDRLAGGVRSDIRVVSAQNPHLLRGARSVFVDHHTLEVALGDALRREEILTAEVEVQRKRGDFFRDALDALNLCPTGDDYPCKGAEGEPCPYLVDGYPDYAACWDEVERGQR